MINYLVQLYKLPHPTFQAAVAISWLVCIWLLLAGFLYFVPNYKKEWKKTLLITSLAALLSFAYVTFFALHVEFYVDIILFKIPREFRLSATTVFIGIALLHLFILSKMRSKLFNAFYALSALSYLLIFSLLYYEALFYDLPLYAFLPRYLYVGLYHLARICLGFFLYHYAFILFSYVLVVLLGIPKYFYPKTSPSEIKKLVYYLLTVIACSLLIPLVSQPLTRFLYELNRHNPCASYADIALFVGHAKELCEYRQNKIECPQTEPDLQAFKPDLYKKIQHCNTTQYYFDNAKNSYIWEVNSAPENIYYVFDLAKVGYPHK